MNFSRRHDKKPSEYSIYLPSKCYKTCFSSGYLTVTHPQVHPLVQHPLAVKLAQQARGGDAEGGVGFGAPSTGHIAEEVVPQLPQQPRAAQQRDGSAGLNTAGDGQLADEH